ncbi:MAG TPA: septal ring lytic transglycosylase RlpA family protein [Solirubrobacterales bacterium]
MGRVLATLTLVPAAALAVSAPSFGEAERAAHIDSGKQRVKYGKRVTLHGKFPDAPNTAIEIRFRRAGADVFRTVRNAKTGPRGGYRVRVRPRATGHWRAEVANPQELRADGGLLAPGTADLETGSHRIRVKSKTKARLSRANVVRGSKTRVKGRVLPATGGRKVVVRVGGKSYTTRTNKKGKFSRSFRVNSTGTRKVRVEAKGDRRATGSKDRAGRVTGYRPAAASYYGPGFYGNRTACGQTLTPGMLGVAHKTMPCGTKLKLMYGGRVVRVRVIDRGPYAGHREFDLTEATKRRLGFGSTGTVYASR